MKTERGLLGGKLYFIVVLVVLLAGIGVGVILGQQVPGPGTGLSVGSLLGEDREWSNETLYISQRDVDYLNRRYRELNTYSGDGVGEEAYCLTVDDEDVLRVHAAGTKNASENHVSYTTANCPRLTGLLHFHPRDSTSLLSDEDSQDQGHNDKDTFLSSNWFRVLCVQSGEESAEPGESTESIKCYSKPDSGDVDDSFPRVSVKIVS